MSDVSFLENLTWKCAPADGEKSAVIITSTAGPRVTRALCRDTRLGSAYSSLLLGVSLKYLGGRTSSSSSSRLCVELGLSLPGTPPRPLQPLRCDWTLELSTVGFCLVSIDPAGDQSLSGPLLGEGSPPHISKAS